MRNQTTNGAADLFLFDIRPRLKSWTCGSGLVVEDLVGQLGTGRREGCRGFPGTAQAYATCAVAIRVGLVDDAALLNRSDNAFSTADAINYVTVGSAQLAALGC